jgi:hypothetical protein
MTAYSEVNGWNIKGLFRGLRDWLLEKEGMEVADRVLPSWSIDSVEIEQPSFPSYSEKATDKAASTNTEESITQHTPSQERSMDPNKKEQQGGEQPPANFAEQISAKDAEIAALKASVAELAKNQLPANFAEQQAATAAQIAALQKTNTRNELKAWLASKEVADRVSPAEMPNVLAFAETLAGIEGTINFGEGADAKTLSHLDAYKAQIAARPVYITRKEVATEENAADGESGLNHSEGQKPIEDEERLAMHKKITAIAAEKNIPYGEAFALYSEAN